MDYEKARRAFERYLDGYPREEEKVRLKMVHTYGVVHCAERIAKGLGLPQEDVELAKLIGLLHDIGRFEQLKRYNSFEPNTMDHAAYGVQVLFGEGQIRQFVEADCWDGIIETAIGRHSDFALPDIADERTLLHTRLIRDADKLDNCRVKLTESVEVLLGVSAEEAGSQEITPFIYEEMCRCRCILSADRKTRMDYWVSYLGQLFDINFAPTFRIVKEKEYIRRTIQRIPCANPVTAKQMRAIEKVLKEYQDRFLCGTTKMKIRELTSSNPG